MSTFTLPNFLKNQSTDEIHRRMLQSLPNDIDKSEGQFAWDYTRPTALEKSQFVEFQLSQAIQLIFPQFAHDEWLDYHAESRGLKRKQATYAEGIITVTGKAGVIIPSNSVFSTESVNGEPSVDFVTVEDVTISETETVDIKVKCTVAGTIGNVPINTIVLKANNISNITSVTNPNNLTGGTEMEDDESLRARILEYDRTQGVSFVGSPSDYKRWAMSVDGVGNAVVISAQDDSGLVTLIITDLEHNPGSETLCQNVYNKIMSPNNKDERLAPVNAYLSVLPPQTLNFTVTAGVEIDGTTTIEEVKKAFFADMKSYLVTAADDNEVKYSRVYSILTKIKGVVDHKDLLINGGTSNIPITVEQLPTISLDDITFTQTAV